MRSAYDRVRLGRPQTVRPFSPLEDEFITAMRIDGAGTTEIARSLSETLGISRTQATINMRLKSLAVLEESEAA